MDGILPQVKKNRIDIILTEGNLLDPVYVSQHPIQILREMNLPVISKYTYFVSILASICHYNLVNMFC